MAPTVALVTGAAGGIGREIVARLVARGIAVAAIDHAPSTTELVVLGSRDASVVPVVTDVLDEQQCIAAVRAAGGQLGAIDVLVNAAGVMHKLPLHEHGAGEWELEMGVNARAAFFFCREILPSMAQRGAGVVVNIASIWGHRGGPDRAAYVASKHAMVGLTRALAAEYGPMLRVNSVSPGPTRTPMTAPLGGDQTAWMLPGEVAEVVDFLCSPAAAGITGTDIEVTGRGRPAGF
jgi:3-oxoacyl-[acyl-carrier protein] reductase